MDIKKIAGIAVVVILVGFFAWRSCQTTDVDPLATDAPIEDVETVVPDNTEEVPTDSE